MHISNERYFHDRQRHDLALRMIRHEARTCTIRSCTGLTDDRIRRLYKTYASHMPSVPVRRRRGKSPRQVAFFVRNARAQLESSMLASVFGTFGLLRDAGAAATRLDRIRPAVLRRVRNASAAAAQRGHLVRARVVSAAAAVAQRRPARGPLPTLRQSVPARSRQPVSSHLPGVHARSERARNGADTIARMALPRSHPNVLAGPYLERAAHWRKDEARSARGAGRSRDVVRAGVAGAQRNRHLGRTDALPRTSRPARMRSPMSTRAAASSCSASFTSTSCSPSAVAGDAPPALASGTELHDLRLIAGELPPEEAGLLAYARAMVHWQSHNRFCGRCALAMLAVQGGHVMQCSNPTCAHQQFPRLDPAVIVLVTDGERALLGRQPAWPAGRYSTIAGFVEPGESLEDAVAREVREETGVVVDAVDYHSSQPWPFPSSLMLGFTAHASQHRHRPERRGAGGRRAGSPAQQIAAGEIALPTRIRSRSA